MYDRLVHHRPSLSVSGVIEHLDFKPEVHKREKQGWGRLG
jgi:hypothetical protein